ncbi:thiamine-phosphate kinase [Pseudodesulfovibrio piezophilus]|uniref:Thiamine-monophosphate kinase n=1 Tax=Pseudodesulfovibrio piezophilus (strain DSM 21447 / JCM 15486 / C1TLV30) TaxID=1322246 RepID=M1WQB7_PSEP2|nr:thiamine-phosphate kinase [Pseudodesulfovibrio piezophilus]CCH47612.1 Thiamine-monophosphate kinase [Pseudodesulfovibrio piezophilus C1TLV30]
MKSEQTFLELIDSFFPCDHDFIKLGRGDDCAVLTGNKDLCVSSDLFIEDIHFRQAYFSPEDIGYKALAVNISDIAAMGAKPIAFTMNIVAPPTLKNDFWKDFFKSMAILAKQNDIVLAGGDLSRGDKLMISITIFGIGGSTGFITRGNCHTGDILFTIGDLGLARTGLLALEKYGEKARTLFPAAVMAHLRPKPKVLIGTLLNAAGVKGLMDISDGLAQDLPRFLGADSGAELEIKEDSLNNDIKKFSEIIQHDPISFTLIGGEDYALLGAVSPFELGKAESVPGFSRIGTVTKAPGIIVNGNPFTGSGFDHFTKTETS